MVPQQNDGPVRVAIVIAVGCQCGNTSRAGHLVRVPYDHIFFTTHPGAVKRGSNT